MNDRAIIGSLVDVLMRDHVCTVCGCHGDSCSLETGEKCVLPEKIGAPCSNPRCITAWHWGKKRDKRERLRPQRARRRTA